MPSDNTSEDIKDWSWHDNVIHGLHLREPDADRGWYHSQLLLDIDHIVEWVEQEGRIHWRVAPATLTFDWVSRLRVAVDFADDALGSAITPWSIHYVEKSPCVLPDGGDGPPCFDWLILLNVPQGGEISFRANRFSLDFRAAPQLLSGGAMQMPGPDRPPLVLT